MRHLFSNLKFVLKATRSISNFAGPLGSLSGSGAGPLEALSGSEAGPLEAHSGSGSGPDQGPAAPDLGPDPLQTYLCPVLYYAGLESAAYGFDQR